jgi:hypothetical protein
LVPSPKAPAPISSASGLSLYATAPSPINVSPNPENCVLPITNIREKQPVELREKRHQTISSIGKKDSSSSTTASSRSFSPGYCGKASFPI